MASEVISKKSDRSRRVLTVLRTVGYFLLVPCIFLGLVPWWMSRWRLEAPLLGFVGFRWVGGLLMAAGIFVFLDSYGRFVFQGRGTPSPLFPTRRLVVTGFYQYVRNPMYLAAMCVVMGQGLYLGDVRVLVYLVFICLMLFLFVIVDEEPTLRRSFGAEYKTYCAHVRRWWPRFRPWREGRD